MSEGRVEIVYVLLIGIIFMVAAYDFTNGFHDAADMVATAIASRAMKPSIAIFLVTFFTFLGPFLVGLAVADTIGNFVKLEGVETVRAEGIILSGLLSAVSYNLITWKLGLPSSSSNSLVGGLIGAALYMLGNSSIHWGWTALQAGHLEGVMKIVAGLFLSPFAGFVVGYVLMKFL